MAFIMTLCPTGIGDVIGVQCPIVFLNFPLMNAPACAVDSIIRSFVTCDAFPIVANHLIDGASIGLPHAMRMMFGPIWMMTSTSSLIPMIVEFEFAVNLEFQSLDIPSWIKTFDYFLDSSSDGMLEDIRDQVDGHSIIAYRFVEILVSVHIQGFCTNLNVLIIFGREHLKMVLDTGRSQDAMVKGFEYDILRPLELMR